MNTEASGMIETDPHIYLVFQMAKVASRSWLNLLKATAPDSTMAHFHTISENRMALIERIVTLRGDTQTIKHMTLGGLGRPPEQIQPFIVNGNWVGPETRIIAGVRDPVARAVSAVGDFCNRLGYTGFGVNARDGGTPENLVDIFYRSLRVAQGIDTKDDTLITLLSHTFADYRLWFKEELAPAFDADISNIPFDRETRCLRLSGTHRIFVYRVEDLLEKNAEQRLLDSASDFLGKRVTTFPQYDVSRETRYQALYSDFVKKIKLSDSDIAWFYDNEIVAKFYTPEEVESFMSKWVCH
jgi:hypothetical protein